MSEQNTERAVHTNDEDLLSRLSKVLVAYGERMNAVAEFWSNNADETREQIAELNEKVAAGDADDDDLEALDMLRARYQHLTGHAMAAMVLGLELRGELEKISFTVPALKTLGSPDPHPLMPEDMGVGFSALRSGEQAMKHCRHCGEELGRDPQALELGYCSGSCVRAGPGLISTVEVETVGGHDHVHVWNRSGKAGTLVVREGDGAEVARRLRETCGPDPRWVLVHVSQRALIYVRRDGPNAALAADDTGELRAALLRVDQALVGVQASEAGGFTGVKRHDVSLKGSTHPIELRQFVLHGSVSNREFQLKRLHVIGKWELYQPDNRDAVLIESDQPMLVTMKREV